MRRLPAPSLESRPVRHAGRLSFSWRTFSTRGSTTPFGRQPRSSWRIIEVEQSLCCASFSWLSPAANRISRMSNGACAGTARPGNHEPEIPAPRPHARKSGSFTAVAERHKSVEPLGFLPLRAALRRARPRGGRSVGGPRARCQRRARLLGQIDQLAAPSAAPAAPALARPLEPPPRRTHRLMVHAATPRDRPVGVLRVIPQLHLNPEPAHAPGRR
jgi:hypothetical protein